MKCRACYSGDIQYILDLGDQYLSDFRTDDLKPKKYPLNLVRCRSCNFVQLEESAPLPEMYTENYGFKSGVNGTIRTDLEDIAKEAMSYIGKRDSYSVLDIGSNDGTLLSYFDDRYQKVGFDPIKKLCIEARQYGEIVNDFFSVESMWEHFGCSRSFDVITAISMFYDVEDPHKLVRDMSELLSKYGVLTIQQNYILSTIQNNSYDNICLAKGELVHTSTGLREIDEIEVGELVLTHKGRYRKVLKKFVTPNNDKQVIKLRAYGAGHDLQVTKNHPIYVKRDGVWEFIPAEQVLLNDIVGKPVVQEAPAYTGAIQVTDNIATIIGFYLAEGSYFKQERGGNVVNFYFNSNERETHIAELMSCLSAEGYSANLFSPKGSSVTVVTTYGDIAVWLYKHFSHHALNKFIPSWVLGQPEPILQSILTAYINGDGYEYRDGYLRASTVSQNLAYGISLIANKLGYKCSITKCKKDASGTILTRAVNIHDLWDILIHIKPVKKMKVWMEDGIQCMRVRQLEFVPYTEESVYNLEVEEDNTYVTPGMTVHNCHEHIGYHSLLSMENILKRYGLEVVHVSTSMVNGGVLRTVIQHEGIGKPDETVQKQRDIEATWGLDSDEVYEKFAHNVRTQAKKLKKLVTEINKSGKKVYIYGASTRGGTIWQYTGLDVNDLPFAVDRNPDKVGKKIASIGVPIISEEQARKDNPEYMLVSIWFFRDEVLKREAEYLKTGKFIFPLPEMEVV